MDPILAGAGGLDRLDRRRQGGGMSNHATDHRRADRRGSTERL